MKKISPYPTTVFSLSASVALTALLMVTGAPAKAGDDGKSLIPQDDSAQYPDWKETDNVKITSHDWAGSVNKYYGQSFSQFQDTDRQIAKVDFDGDFNYDGVISNEDPADNGAFQRTPPGLVVGVGELTKVILRVTPYRVDFGGNAVVALEVRGINRSVRSGDFASFEEEVAKTSRIRVWRDATKKVLLLDSHDPDKRRVEWTMDAQRKALGGVITGLNLPNQNHPRALYVEGVKAHGPYIGDVRLLLSIDHREADPGRATLSRSLRRFRTSWSTALLTVTPQPMEKEFVVSPALQDIWIKP